MLSIFQTETTALESQVTALQAQLAAAQQRIALLNETELLAGDSLGVLKDAINKVSALAPSAITSLRRAVLNLFQGNDGNNDNGNQPIKPSPQPIEPAPELIKENMEATSTEEEAGLALKEETDRTATVAAVSEQVKPELIKVETDSTSSNVLQPEPEQLPYVELIPVTHLVAYQRREYDGEIICCYLAGNNKSRLKDWGSWLCNLHSVGSGFELREAYRMTAYKWELKIWGMNLKQVMRLSETDTTKAVPSRYHVASFPVAENLLQTDEDTKTEIETAPELRAYQVGDRVEVITDRQGKEFVGETGLVTLATVAGVAVNVGSKGTLRWFVTDEVLLVEPTSPRDAADDLFQPATVNAPASVPGYRLNPIGRAGATANWNAMQAAGRGVNLRDCGTATAEIEVEPDF